MLGTTGSLHNEKKVQKRYFKIICISIFFVIFSSVIFIAFNYNFFAEAGNTYTPLAPNGSSQGEINIDYKFKVYTLDADSYWMFDWGDGNYSGWVQLQGLETYISENHSWTSNGIYEVKVKNKNNFNEISPWSSPLKVYIGITPPTTEEVDEDESEGSSESDSNSNTNASSNSGLTNNNYNEIPWMYIIFGIVIGVILTILILIKKGYIYLYEEEYISED